MQSNDLNILAGSWDIQDLKDPFSMINNIRISELPSNGRLVTKEDINKAKEVKIHVPQEMLIEVRKTVSYYENLGKSRRWIRRYIKRKYNITEY